MVGQDPEPGIGRLLLGVANALHVVAVDGEVVGRRDEGHGDEWSHYEGVRQPGHEPLGVRQAEGGQQGLDADHPVPPGGVEVHQGTDEFEGPEQAEEVEMAERASDVWWRGPVPGWCIGPLGNRLP